MKRGFTLIELLAVIVILAIIAIIAVPIVLGIINDSRKSSQKESIKLYLDTVEKTITQENLKTQYNPEECLVQEDGNLKCSANGQELNISDSLKIDMEGEKPTSGIIKIKDGKIIEQGRHDELINKRKADFSSYFLAEERISGQEMRILHVFR